MGSDSNHDDLDDLLDDFELHEKILSQAPGSAIKKEEKTYERNLKEDDEPPPLSDLRLDDPPAAQDEEFSKKLQSDMDQLMQEMNDDPQAQKAFETLMADLQGKVDPTGSRSSDSKDFKDTINETMNRLNEQGNSMNQPNSDEFLSKMLGELQNTAGGDVDSLLAGLMEELQSKDILYEPLRELNEKYPAFLVKHADDPEIERYRGQSKVVSEIVAKFEAADYSDTDSKCRQYIAERMEAMQRSGNPPDELIGALSDGSEPNCPMQ